MTTAPIAQIIVPIDFSPHSSAAVRWAAYWQQQSGAQVSVLHCRQYEAPPSFTLEQVEEIAQQAVRSETQVRDEVMAFLTQTLNHDVDWTIHVEEGDPVQLILAQCACADMVIMGTHGRHGLRRWMLGSVAEAMIKSVKIPVLVVRHPYEHTLEQPHVQRLLLPVTYDARDRNTFEHAAQVAALFGAELVTLHVNEQHDSVEEPVLFPERLHGVAIQQLLRSGKPAEQILATAGEISADVVVLSSKPKRFLDIDILPATVIQVLQYGQVPVLMVPYLAQGGQL